QRPAQPAPVGNNQEISNTTKKNVATTIRAQRKSRIWLSPLNPANTVSDDRRNQAIVPGHLTAKVLGNEVIGNVESSGVSRKYLCHAERTNFRQRRHFARSS